MKQIIILLVIIMTVSCAKQRDPSDMHFETEEIYETDLDYDAKTMGVNYADLSIQKLSEYFELIQLQQQHPEFDDDIQLQISGLIKDSTILKAYPEPFSITNIEPADSIIKLSDSLHSVTLYFDVLSNNKTSKDSIVALITTKTILLDAQEVVSTKVTFQKD